MADPKVWVSTEMRDVVVDGADGPGSRWEYVGTIDTAQESQLWKHIQAHIGARASRPRINDFYLHGTPSSPWVIRAREHPDEIGSFWIAIDPLGDGTRYLVTVAQASVGTLARRPTESHPGLLARAITLGIRLQEVERRIFNVHPDE
jgi:hypothetical protein